MRHPSPPSPSGTERRTDRVRPTGAEHATASLAKPIRYGDSVIPADIAAISEVPTTRFPAMAD